MLLLDQFEEWQPNGLWIVVPTIRNDFRRPRD